MPTAVAEKISYSLLPSAGSKTISLRVNRDGSVTVRAPRHISEDDVAEFVSKRAGWIVEKQNYFERLSQVYPPKEFKNGESFEFLGRNLRLKLFRAAGRKDARCEVTDGRLKLFLDGQTGVELKTVAARAIRDLYSRHTALRARAFVRKHAASLAIKPGRILIVDVKKRWGSCARNGDVRLNWRISMMPPAVIEYIIVHELCHLKIHSHSPKFWSILKSILPDYENRRAWLRQHGPAALLVSDWG